MTRKERFKSSPRMPDQGPSSFLHKLEPWFVDLAGVLGKPAKQKVVGRPRKHRSGHTYEEKRRPLGQPPVVQPWWPRTIGDLFALLAQCVDEREAQIIHDMQQKFSPRELATDVNQALPSVISLLKYQETVPELWWREMQGDPKAGRHMVETVDLYNRWIHDQLPHGRVRFKTNVHHNLLMIYGLPAGLQRLTSRELVEFFDQFCPCGSTHSQEVLNRLRNKLLNSIARGRKAMDSIVAADAVTKG